MKFQNNDKKSKKYNKRKIFINPTKKFSKQQKMSKKIITNENFL